MIIAIGGQQYAGKTTFAKMLARELGWQTVSTSDCLLTRVSQSLSLSPETILSRKHIFREEFIAIGRVVEAAHGPAGVARLALKGCTGQDVIFESIRRGVEVTFFKGLPDVVFILMDASRETRASRGTLACEDDLTEWEGVEALQQVSGLITITNEGSLDDLAQKAAEIAAQVRAKSAVAQ